MRSKVEGGKLREPGELKAALDAKTRRNASCWFMGSTTPIARCSCLPGLCARQKEIFGTPDFSGFERRFGDTFWPGDADWWWFLDKLDFLIYPAAVHTSVRAARDLANLLWEMPNLERVDFIAHSLGCRVVLETLLLLRARSLPIVGRVVSMAAAVPSEMLEPGGKFFELLSVLEGEGTRIQVLYSEQDWVLHYTFPPGQGGRRKRSVVARRRQVRLVAEDARPSLNGRRPQNRRSAAWRLLGAQQNSALKGSDGSSRPVPVSRRSSARAWQRSGTWRRYHSTAPAPVGCSSALAIPDSFKIDYIALNASAAALDTLPECPSVAPRRKRLW